MILEHFGKWEEKTGLRRCLIGLNPEKDIIRKSQIYMERERTVWAKNYERKW